MTGASRFRVFTPTNVAIYGVGGLGGAIGLTLVNALVPGIEPVGRAIFGVAAVAFAVIPTVYFALRMRYAEAFDRDLIGYTSQGVAVLADVDRADVDECVLDVEADIAWTIDFWIGRRGMGFATPSGDVKAMLALFAGGGTLRFVPEVIEWAGNAPIPGVTRRAVGLTRGNQMGVWWAKGEPYPSARVRHEAAHVCLTALGVPPEQHHAVMAQHGFPV